MDKQIRDLFHLTKSEDLTGQQIKQGFGQIFLSKDTIDNQMVTQEIVNQVASVKAPFYGSQIPNSAVIVAKTADGGLEPVFTPSPNKTYRIMAADVLNIGSSSVSVDFGLLDSNLNFVKLANVSPNAGGQNAIELRGLQFFDSDVFPGFIVISGTPSDCVVQVAYAEVVQ